MRYNLWYTRIIGIFFLLVLITLVTDTATRGITYETGHKVFHILLGFYAILIGWGGMLSQWKSFTRFNGAFFAVVAATGWLFPDLGGLDAFNRTDTILHSIVALTGLVGFLVKK